MCSPSGPDISVDPVFDKKKCRPTGQTGIFNGEMSDQIDELGQNYT